MFAGWLGEAGLKQAVAWMALAFGTGILLKELTNPTKSAVATLVFASCAVALSLVLITTRPPSEPSEYGLAAPKGIAVTADGTLYVSSSGSNQVHKVSPLGALTVFAGTREGFGGDGGPATKAELLRPGGVAIARDGSLFIADTGNNRVRRIRDGIIATVAGTGEPGFDGDGGLATQARLFRPRAVAVAADGVLYIADRDNWRVRRVGQDGTITTFAGTGERGFGGDEGPRHPGSNRRHGWGSRHR